jgi:hypothetical protein
MANFGEEPCFCFVDQIRYVNYGSNFYYINICEILGSCGGKYQVYGVGCDVLQFGEWVQTF